ncbi:hypothetical protein L5515_009458 [Caenorhabditis briggsae]|uniref:Uncharacterized protein n=1 Tax=Caenorhabditis briggsae TaxID=6238 RepID=A0AAE9JN14_CAEBR|nr:hypothetical protein L5515_009458 [Caenorhabditis briggsae]
MNTEMELCKALQALDMGDSTSRGFCVELDEENAKFYTIEYGLVQMERTDEPTSLGKYYDIFGDYYEFSAEPISRCEVWEENGEVFVKTYAITPNVLQLPKDMAKRFRYRVWSPFLKYLNDPEEKFIDYFSGGTVGKIKTKYNPSGNSVFEIVEIYKEKVPRMGTGFMLATPWTMEFIYKNVKSTCLADQHNLLAINKDYKASDQDRQIGIVIVAEYANLASARSWRTPPPGYKDTISYIFSRNLGIIRWAHNDPVIYQEHPEGHLNQRADPNHRVQDAKEVKFRLGKWVAFGLNQKRRDTTSSIGPNRGILRYTASKVEVVADQKLTRTDSGVLEMDASFLFNHEELENPENASKEWTSRFAYLSKTAHFWDMELGRVEIYPLVAKVILEEIENHRNSLSPADKERLKEEAIVVSVATKVHHKWLQNFHRYPETGVFFAHRVLKIFYLDGGKPIFKAQALEN